MQANPNTPSLGSVVSEWDVLTVEDYQRTYSWQREEIDEFFGDLRETAANKEAHFFGTLILQSNTCLLYTSPSPRDLSTSRMPSSA